jgi:arylsulfatase A-like enzyme
MKASPLSEHLTQKVNSWKDKMISKRFTVATLAGLAAAHLYAASAGELAGSKPNIILVMTDDQGYGQLGCQGHPWLETPNIDKLCEQSTVFTDFHVSPTCSPTRAALLTGNVPFKNGVTHTVEPRNRMALSAVTIPQYLKKVGYTSGIFGKWHLGLEEQYQPGARGFDEVFIHGYGAIGQGKDVPKNKYYDPVLRHNGVFVKTKGFCTDIFFSQALAWIRENKHRPFFAYISTNAPHSPFVAPDHKMQKFSHDGFKEQQQGFYGMIENIDENMGRLMSRLNEWGLEENTIVVFLSDNGFVSSGLGEGTLGARDGEPLFAYTAGLKGAKGTLHEGGTRVPAFFRWKGVLQEGAEVNALSAHIDMLPTLVELAGGELPMHIDGKSLVSLLKDPSAQRSDRKLFFHCGRWKDNIGPDKSKYAKSKGTGFAVRNSHYRLVNNEKLYDIVSDPGEANNIYAQKPEVVKEMQDAYDQWWDEVRPFMINEGKKTGPNPYHVQYKEQLKQQGIPSWAKPEW